MLYLQQIPLATVSTNGPRSRDAVCKAEEHARSPANRCADPWGTNALPNQQGIGFSRLLKLRALLTPWSDTKHPFVHWSVDPSASPCTVVMLHPGIRRPAFSYQLVKSTNTAVCTHENLPSTTVERKVKDPKMHLWPIMLADPLARARPPCVQERADLSCPLRETAARWVL